VRGMEGVVRGVQVREIYVEELPAFARQSVFFYESSAGSSQAVSDVVVLTK
jgi:hypothetical protein